MRDTSRDRIAVLCASRCNSEWLAHFCMSYLAATANNAETKLNVIYNAHDLWNYSLRLALWNQIHFLPEDLGIGRYGLHQYYNGMAARLLADESFDWLLFMSDDMEFIREGWDESLRETIGNHNLDPARICAVIPRFVHTGSVAFLLSRGYVEGVEGEIAGHHSVDSWISDVVRSLPGERVAVMSEYLFDDYTAAPCLKGKTPPLPAEVPVPVQLREHMASLSAISDQAVKLNDLIAGGTA